MLGIVSVSLTSQPLMAAYSHEPKTPLIKFLKGNSSVSFSMNLFIVHNTWFITSGLQNDSDM